MLIIEVVATRILSPFFGNTIYTVSSVISVVLAALSVGYVIGGRLADRRLRHSRRVRGAASQAQISDGEGPRQTGCEMEAL